MIIQIFEGLIRRLLLIYAFARIFEIVLRRQRKIQRSITISMISLIILRIILIIGLISDNSNIWRMNRRLLLIYAFARIFEIVLRRQRKIQRSITINVISLIILRFISILGLISDNSNIWRINKKIITNLRIRKNIRNRIKKTKKDSEEYYY